MLFSFASTAQAKTEGNYVGLNLTQSKVLFYQKYSDAVETNGALIKPAFSNARDNTGVGIDYKHAFNFNKFFVAPGIFFDYLNAKAKGKDSYNNEYGVNDQGSQLRVQIKNRYGAKVDFGYDINDTFSPYVSLGRAYVSYNTRLPTLDYDFNSITQLRNTRANSWIYGAGLKINYNENYAINLGYDWQRFVAKTTSDVGMGIPFSQTLVFKTTIQTVRLGITRKF